VGTVWDAAERTAMGNGQSAMVNLDYYFYFKKEKSARRLSRYCHYEKINSLPIAHCPLPYIAA
jgi:hypothetical protein